MSIASVHPERSAKRAVEGRPDGADVERLGTQGWFTTDELISRAHALEALKHARSQPLTPAAIRKSRDLNPAIRGDETTWLDASPLHEAFENLRQQLNRTAYLGLTRFDVQLARYDAGARYARHRDAFPGSDNRRVTAIVYLNETWRPEHGGQLRLHVEPPVDLEPLLGRLVVFLSDKIDHEVLPAHAPRLAVTAWYYGPSL